MWNYEKRLEYPVNITTPNPKIAQIIMSQYEHRSSIPDDKGKKQCLCGFAGFRNKNQETKKSKYMVEAFS